jgi:multiple sugar transport system permease protein
VALVAARSERSRLHLGASVRRALLGYAFIMPWLVGFLCFTAGPILAVFYFSFSEYSIFSAPHPIGLKNYLTALGSDRLFPISLGNTLYYVGLAVPLDLVCGFLLALALNARLSGITIFRTLFYVPAIVPTVAATIVFVWLFDPNLGLINFGLSLVGILGPNWLGSEAWAKPAIVLLSLWHVGGSMIIFLAGLQGIPEHLYEAAAIDGAAHWRKLWHVTVPLMTPTILYNAIVGIIGSFQVFATAYIATGGGPRNATLFYVLYIYQKAFQDFSLGYASALAWILFLLVLTFTLLVFRSSRSWVHYEET